MQYEKDHGHLDLVYLLALQKLTSHHRLKRSYNDTVIMAQAI